MSKRGKNAATNGLLAVGQGSYTDITGSVPCETPVANQLMDAHTGNGSQS